MLETILPGMQDQLSGTCFGGQEEEIGFQEREIGLQEGKLTVRNE